MYLHAGGCCLGVMTPKCCCFALFSAESCRNYVGLKLFKRIDFFPAVAARHFERSTIRSRSFKKINKAFSVLRRTKSGSAVSSQADQEREAVGNCVAGEEGNALLSLYSYLNGTRDPMHVGAGCPRLTCISFCGCT